MMNDFLLLQIFIILKSISNKSYLVGGCVRDVLLGLTPKDFDIVTTAPYGAVVEAFNNSDWSVSCNGENFLVCCVSKFGKQFEIANFRKDSSFGDGRRPDSVEVGTIEEDAARRDFTINALYLDPWTDEVLDPTGFGYEDCMSKVLRFVGRPQQRLKEDYLRAFRFYRFINKGFKPIPSHLRCVREMFNECVEKTNPERIRSELEKIVGL